MSVYGYTLIAIAFSLLWLLLLALADRKRARVDRRSPTLGMPQRARKVLVLLVALPGVIFTAFSLYAPLLLWLGSVLVAGWLLALLFSILAETSET